MSYSLQGKRALVTGSSGGIGKGIALELAKHGASVLIHFHTREQGANDTAAEITRLYGHERVAGIVQCDFRSPLDIQRMFLDDLDQRIWSTSIHSSESMADGSSSCQRAGQFDILVNNAGIVTKQAMEDESLPAVDSWHECLAVNVHAPRILSQYAMERMKDGKGGVILNVGRCVLPTI
jgi:NAD(P)-dependent dehydrogenase (short-subunit alcohol dehydrogenase family)